MNVAINGLGRIGRAIFKILMANPELNVVAINDVTPPDNLPICSLRPKKSTRSFFRRREANRIPSSV